MNLFDYYMVLLYGISTFPPGLNTEHNAIGLSQLIIWAHTIILLESCGS